MMGLKRYDPNLELIPLDVLEASYIVHQWFAKRDIDEWACGPVQSRFHPVENLESDALLQQLRELAISWIHRGKSPNDYCDGYDDGQNNCSEELLAIIEGSKKV